LVLGEGVRQETILTHSLPFPGLWRDDQTYREVISRNVGQLNIWFRSYGS